VLQANAMGIPCIVSDINGCNEIIKEGENGIIIPTKNSEILQQKMELLLEKSNLFKASKAEIRKGIIAKFKRQILWNLLLEEYKTLENNV
jgi:glycosyltransferase involved in cell wall biosynthesis